MRTSTIQRTTKETDIQLVLSLDGGNVRVSTGVGFLDHMLTAMAFHGGLGLNVKAHGDLNVDSHHTVEDVGIVLGQALAQALGDKAGIARFGNSFVPMDEALVQCCLDISGRPFLAFEAPMPQEKIGEYDACLTQEFLRAFAFNAGVTLHVRCMAGVNAHHITEAIFKATGRALRQAIRVEGTTVLSSKGML